MRDLPPAPSPRHPFVVEGARLSRFWVASRAGGLCAGRPMREDTVGHRLGCCGVGGRRRSGMGLQESRRFSDVEPESIQGSFRRMRVQRCRLSRRRSGLRFWL
jgi:hypothetical protein